jgi:threonyl-tRNA synthetase
VSINYSDLRVGVPSLRWFQKPVAASPQSDSIAKRVTTGVFVLSDWVHTHFEPLHTSLLFLLSPFPFFMLARALFNSRSLCTKRLKPTRFATTLAPFRSYTPSTPTMAPKAKKDEGSARPLEMTPPPDYFATRNAIFDKRKAERDAWVAEQPREEIDITLASGDVKKGTSWETTPGNIAREISKSLFERTVISRVDGELWDLERPFEKSGKLELLDFDHPEGKKVFWHSSAHILGEACERHYGCALCIGPPVDDGFYYEMSLPDGAAVSHADYKPLKQVAEKAIKEKQPFERLELSKEDLLEMFAYNKYKQHIIQDKIPDGTSTTVYRCGPLIDLCRGPHVPHTGRIKAFDIMKNSASYFLGDAKNDSLQRIYGVSFPDKAVSFGVSI